MITQVMRIGEVLEEMVPRDFRSRMLCSMFLYDIFIVFISRYQYDYEYRVQSCGKTFAKIYSIDLANLTILQHSTYTVNITYFYRLHIFPSGPSTVRKINFFTPVHNHRDTILSNTKKLTRVL